MISELNNFLKWTERSFSLKDGEWLLKNTTKVIPREKVVLEYLRYKVKHF